MATTKRSDDDGYKRGAMGIDGSKDDAFSRNADQKDTDAMYGRGIYQGNRKGTAPVDCDYLEEGESNSKVQEGAREGNRPLLGRGSPTDPIQTGFRKKPRSGAF
jgi:hypothetical protein